jgi:hypothetical protein
MIDKTHSEHYESGYPPIADIQAHIDLRRFGPILLQKSGVKDVSAVLTIFEARARPWFPPSHVGRQL